MGEGPAHCGRCHSRAGGPEFFIFWHISSNAGAYCLMGKVIDGSLCPLSGAGVSGTMLFIELLEFPDEGPHVQGNKVPCPRSVRAPEPDKLERVWAVFIYNSREGTTDFTLWRMCLGFLKFPQSRKQRQRGEELGLETGLTMTCKARLYWSTSCSHVPHCKVLQSFWTVPPRGDQVFKQCF